MLRPLTAPEKRLNTDSILCLNAQGYHRMVYQQWGDANNPNVVVCVHGLARNSRDFDDLARSLQADYRVICADVVGRGASDWLPAGVEYGITQYLQDMVALLARLNVAQVDWVGTSMGGLIGMLLAAFPSSPIRRLVLNDIGPFVPQQALQRIGSYVGLDPRFDSVQEVETMLRANYPAFSGLTDQQWRHLAQYGSRDAGDGSLALHYDPAIGHYTRQAANQDVDLWAMWKQVQCPQLLLWGEQSDVLTRETVSAMQQATPSLKLATWPDIGHAPSLMEPEQITTIREWLQSTNESH